MNRIFNCAALSLILTVSFNSFAQTASKDDEAKTTEKPASALAIRQPDPVGGPLPSKVIDQLGLTAEQGQMLDTAMKARKDAQTLNEGTREVSYKQLTEQLSSDKFDPRIVIKQREQARTAMDARIDAVQQKWLLFWDSLSQTQRNMLVQYMREQHAALAKQRSK